MAANTPVMKDIIVVESFDFLGTDVIMNTPCGSIYLSDDFDIPGDDGYYYPKKHSKKKNKSARIRYENTKNLVVERPIPKHKKKKYPTKPKNSSKISKVKESRKMYM
tara:strand:- start:142 stop:462 length:321 start_codon:yes stop_codon:yes gene_type:complete